MARLPDRFDLGVRKARECRNPERQTDFVLGALAGLREWHFLNIGSKEEPQPAQVEIENARYLLIFSDRGRIEELIDEKGFVPSGNPLPVITMPVAQAMPWCLERRTAGCAGLLVNPGEDAFMAQMDQVEVFYAEWKKRGGREASGFWIPNMTTEEEDFWQERGL